jgi:hypothetical protein
MDRAVIEALEMQHYRPATLNGIAVEVNYDFLVIPKVPSKTQSGAENVTSVPAAVE